MLSTVSFVAAESTESDEWRSIILFGRNVASYKFALGKTLIELVRSGREAVTLEELAEPFARYLCQHLGLVDSQGTFEHSRFLDACRFYNAGDIELDELITATSLLGSVNVINAFHHVGGTDTATRFFIDERTRSTREIRLTVQSSSWPTLPILTTTSARLKRAGDSWSAPGKRDWTANRSSSCTTHPESCWCRLCSERRTFTEVRPALSGYQKGHCFYCSPILVTPNSPQPIAFPHRSP